MSESEVTSSEQASERCSDNNPTNSDNITNYDKSEPDRPEVEQTDDESTHPSFDRQPPGASKEDTGAEKDLTAEQNLTAVQDKKDEQDLITDKVRTNENFSRIRRMKEARKSFKNDRKRYEFREGDEQDLKLRTARTKKGAGMLRSTEVSAEDLQDRSKPVEIVGADVESLYPNLSDVHIADIVYKAIMETEVKLENINYKEAVRYLALNWTEKECRMSEVRRALPWRLSKQGSRPGMTGAGPMGPDEGTVCQWTFPRITLSELEKKKILANVMRISVLTMFHSHIYTFDNNFYLQKQGGPIGLRATCAVARLTMIEWDREWTKLLTTLGLSFEEAARYMDDLRVYLYGIKQGWRWYDGELCWTEEWEQEDRVSGRSDLERTCDILKTSMNMVFTFMNFTIESALDFADCRLPTLDFKLWVRADNQIMFTFFEKPTCSNQVLNRFTALSENTKVSNMTSEVIRRMMHVSEQLPMDERVVVLDRLGQKLANSDYDLAMIRRGMIGGLKGYEKRLEQSRKHVDSLGYRALHESAGVSFGARSLKKLTGKSSWFKQKPREKRDGEELVQTAMTKQEYRKLERKSRKLEKRTTDLQADFSEYIRISL